MVSFQELSARVHESFRFTKQELSGIVAAILFTGFIFSFGDWGDDVFDLFIGLGNLIVMTLIAAFTFFFRLSCQKIYALSQGYYSEFKVWWTGLVIALLLAFITAALSGGRFILPVVLAGGVATTLMVRQRLGEFRYGFSYVDNGVIAMWGMIGNIILAIIFALGLFIAPGSYIFSKGLTLNLIMGFTMLIPLPQLEGLSIFFGRPGFYYAGLVAMALMSLLLLSKTKIGLVIAILISSIVGIVFLLIGSEK